MTGLHLIAKCIVLIMYGIEGGTRIVRTYGKNCVVNGQSMECGDKIPVFIPTGITHVKLTDLKCNESSSPETFQNQTWGKIMSLDISWQEKKESNMSIKNDTFKIMSSLQTLGLHVRGCEMVHVYQLEHGAFDGLESLVELNVSNNERFSFDIFSRILDTETAFPNLKTLLMNYFSIDGFSDVQINLNDSVLTALGRRNLTCLETNGNIIHVLYVNPANIIFNYLEVLSLKSVQLYRVEAGHMPIDKYYKSLRTLDISEFRFPALISSLENVYSERVLEEKRCIIRHTFYLILRLVQHLETIIANNNINGKTVSLPFNCTLIIPSLNFTFFLKQMSLQGNHIKQFGFEIKTNITFMLKVLDLRYNDIEYFDSPHLLSYMLSTILLAHNKLHIMLETNPDQFTEMFKHLRNLQVVDISYNKLPYIPKTMFEHNKNIREIYLSGNNLIQFYQTFVFPCRLIDLANNDIDMLNDMNMYWFERINDKSNGSLQLHIDSNPFQCRCNSHNFVHWLLTADFVVNQNLDCRLDGVQMAINKDTYAKIQNDCNVKLKYIIISSVAVFTLCVSFIAVKLGQRLLHRHNTKRKARSVLRQLRNGCFKFRFLSFLIYSDSDSEIVLEHLCPLLKDTFKNEVGDIETEDLKLVGIGDRHFLPGYGIMDEVNRCFKDTAVILAVISNAFCESVFCKNELDFAIILNKPVVLLFVENISEESMSACVRQHFNKNVRVKIEMIDAEIKVTPHVNDVCSAIFGLGY